MPFSVITLKSESIADQLIKKLLEESVQLDDYQLVRPSSKAIPSSTNPIDGSRKVDLLMNSVELESVQMLSSKASRQKQQRSMASWLMPFGFLAGLTFSKMTGLKTFSFLGVGPIGESMIGGLLGMFSGLIGSYFSAFTNNSEKIGHLKNFKKSNEEGLWLLIIETPFHIELPWQIVQKFDPVEVIQLPDS